MEVDEKGFVFVWNGKAYWIASWEGEVWQFYWHAYQKNWVSLRKPSEAEVARWRQIALPEAQANLYHNYHELFKSPTTE